jgi:hypothetical protein
MASCQSDSSAITACLAGYQKFQTFLQERETKVQLQQIETALWEDKMALWNEFKRQQDQKLQNGHTAPSGYVWNSINQIVQCNSLSGRGIGPFNLCGYHPIERKRCKAVERGVSGEENKKLYRADNNGELCNCASCAEGCCISIQDATVNNNVSWYQGTYNNLMNSNPPPNGGRAPMFLDLPPVGTTDFVCQQCQQCQDFSDIDSGGAVINITAPEQVMSCVTNMQTAQSTSSPASSSLAKTIADEKIAIDQEQKKLTSQKTIVFMVFIIILIVSVIGVVTGLVIQHMITTILSGVFVMCSAAGGLISYTILKSKQTKLDQRKQDLQYMISNLADLQAKDIILTQQAAAQAQQQAAEQQYQLELSSTQALNKARENAAAELLAYKRKLNL